MILKSRVEMIFKCSSESRVLKKKTTKEQCRRQSTRAMLKYNATREYETDEEEVEKHSIHEIPQLTFFLRNMSWLLALILVSFLSHSLLIRVVVVVVDIHRCRLQCALISSSEKHKTESLMLVDQHATRNISATRNLYEFTFILSIRS